MNKRDISNHDLVVMIKKSDHHAFKILYNRLWKFLYMKAYSILRDKDMAKNIVQEIWISFWERRDKISNDNIEGYLFRAVRFKVYNEFRNSKYRNKLIEEFVQNYKPDNQTNNIEKIIHLEETRKSILKIVDNLPKKCRQVFELSRFDDLKNEEIAQKLNISKRTVETHISNALKILKNNIML